MNTTAYIRVMIFVICLSAWTCLPSASAHTSSDLTSIDSVSYRYRFVPKDSLLYRVVSNDSIAFAGQAPLIKERTEMYLIICDSVGTNGHYYISQQLTKFASKESSGDIRDRVRLETTWLGRKIWYEIDSLGNRYSYGADDSVRADIAPGGAFQPNLLIPIKESRKKIGESWIVETLDDLPENCIPAPLRKQTSIFRSLPSLDTLGTWCDQFQYTLTGQGSVLLQYSNGQMIRANSIIAQFGKMEINSSYQVPHHLYATAEVKLTLKLPDGKEMKGQHFITSNYSLVEMHTQRPAAVVKKTAAEPATKKKSAVTRTKKKK